MRNTIRKAGLLMAVLSMGLNIGFAGATHFNETLPDPSANSSVKLGAMPVSNGYDWSLTTDTGSPVYSVFQSGMILGPGTGVTTGTTTGAQGTFGSYAVLNGATNAVQGSVLCSSATVAGAVGVFVCPATYNLGTVVGIANAAATVGGVVDVVTNGFAVAFATSTVAVGDQLSTSASGAGYLATNNISSDTIVGIAMQTEAVNTSGLILIRVH